MSVLPGSGGVAGPRLSDLNAYVAKDASAFVVRDGTLESNIGMAFSSGLYRFFGMEKSKDDISANQETLKFLLGQVRDSLATHAGREGDAIYKRVLDGKTTLPGDSRPIMLKERFARGTYVSSELIRQIKTIAQNELRKADVEGQRKADNFRRFGPANKAVVQQFFGHEPDLEDVGLIDTAKIKLSQLATQLMGETKPGFMQAIEELIRDGTPDFSAEMKPAWDAFADFWLRGKGDASGARDKVLARLELRMRVTAGNLASEGAAISADKMKEVIKKTLTEPSMFSRFVDLANTQMLESLETSDLADAIRVWNRVNKDPDVTDQDCEWLAYELEEASETNRLIDLPENKSFATEIRKMFRSYREDRDPFSLADTLKDEVRQNHEKSTAPIGISDHERFQWLKENCGGGKEGAYRAYCGLFKPRVYTKADIAGLIGDSIKPMLLEHKARMAEINKEQNAERSRRESALNRVLDPFLHLQVEKKKLNDLDYDRLNQPTTASDFIKGMLVPAVVGAATEQVRTDLQSAWGVTEENRNRFYDANPDKREQLHVSLQGTVASTESAENEILDNILPVVDEYTKLHEEITALREQEGGLAGANLEKLNELNVKARKLGGRTAELSTHAKELDAKYAHANMGPISEFCNAMVYAAVMIKSGTGNYLRTNESQKASEERMKALDEEIKALFESGLAALTKMQSLSSSELESLDPEKQSQIGELQPLIREAVDVPSSSTNPFDAQNLPVNVPITSPPSTNPFDPSFRDPRGYNPFV